VDITEREAAILEAVIDEYVPSAVPIGSVTLTEKYDWELSPASVRAVLASLEDKGYLAQPHTSAGRVPTDKAYRWFVNETRQRQNQEPSAREQSLLRKRMESHRSSYERRVHALSETLAEMTAQAALARVENETRLFGLANILRQPEYQLPSSALYLAEVIDRLDSLAREISDKPGTRVYIGREVPFGRSADYSLVVSSFHSPQGDRITLGVLGPTRIAYPKVIELVDYTTQLLEEKYA
jgi:heat-inducible transcriptional repressor